MKIKFRGRGLKDKKLYYGSYVHTMPQSSFPAILDNDGFYNEVDPESVTQFVGYDMNGDGVYEGDMVKDNYGESFSTAAYIGLESEKSFMIVCDVGDTIFGYRRREFNFKLEEGDNDNL